MVLVVFLNKKLFHLNDLDSAIVGLIFGIISSIAYGLSNNSWLFYLASTIESGFFIFRTSVETFYTKIVNSDEAAKSNAVLAAMFSALLPMFAAMYNLIYKYLVEIYISLVYFLSCGFFLMAIVFALVLKSIVVKKLGSGTGGEVEQRQ